MSARTHLVVAKELKRHAPFTAVGALTGIALMALVVVCRVPHEVSEWAFDVLHPGHVFFSAVVTAALYRRYKRNLLLTAIIGYVGSVGIGTLSDIVLPYLGGRLVGAEMHHMHIGFIEHWYVVNPLALAGVVWALWRPSTKLPHSAHMFLSTWASLFYLTAHGEANWLPLLPVIFVVLFVAVWLPCCLSDIVFPLLFVGDAAAGEHVHDH
jgi:hypothetical protein